MRLTIDWMKTINERHDLTESETSNAADKLKRWLSYITIKEAPDMLEKRRISEARMNRRDANASKKMLKQG